MAKKTKKTEEPEALTDKQLFSLAHEHEDAKANESKWKGLKDRAKTRILTEMARRDAKTITQDSTGLRITRTQAETVIYDQEGIRLDTKIKAAIRRRIFRRSWNFAMLTKERQAEVQAAIIAMLTPAERRACTVWTLDVDAMSREVQAGDLDPKLIAPHSEIKKSAAYVTISLGAES